MMSKITPFISSHDREEVIQHAHYPHTEIGAVKLQRSLVVFLIFFYSCVYPTVKSQNVYYGKCLFNSLQPVIVTSLETCRETQEQGPTGFSFLKRLRASPS